MGVGLPNYKGNQLSLFGNKDGELEIVDWKTNLLQPKYKRLRTC